MARSADSPRTRSRMNSAPPELPHFGHDAGPSIGASTTTSISNIVGLSLRCGCIVWSGCHQNPSSVTIGSVRSRLRSFISILVVAALAAACTTDTTLDSTPPRSPSSTEPPAATTPVITNETGADGDCQATLTEAGGIGSEARADSNDGFEVWALIFNTWNLPYGDPVTIPAQREVKIVWRATGEGDLSLEAIGPDNAIAVPDWGPEAHLGSNWDRPGDEWGTGWTLPDAGCWTFRVTRGNQTATLTADVFLG